MRLTLLFKVKAMSSLFLNEGKKERKKRTKRSLTDGKMEDQQPKKRPKTSKITEKQVKL